MITINYQFTAIVIAIVCSSVVTLAIANYVMNHKNNESNNANIITIMNYFGTITAKLYNIYEEFGRIDISNFDSDQEYRKSVINSAIQSIIEVLRDNNIEVNIDKNVLESIAVVVVEKVISIYEDKNKEKQINDLEKELNAPKEEIDRDKATVDLGNFID